MIAVIVSVLAASVILLLLLLVGITRSKTKYDRIVDDEEQARQVRKLKKRKKRQGYFREKEMRPR